MRIRGFTSMRYINRLFTYLLTSVDRTAAVGRNSTRSSDHHIGNWHVDCQHSSLVLFCWCLRKEYERRPLKAEMSWLRRILRVTREETRSGIQKYDKYYNR